MFVQFRESRLAEVFSTRPTAPLMRLIIVMIVMFCQLFCARAKGCLRRELSVRVLVCVCVSAAGEPWRREDKSAAGSFVATKFDTSFDLENLVCPLLDFHDTSRIAANSSPTNVNCS